MSKKLVIFDCDGVLVDSEVIAHRVLAEGLSRLGCSLTIEESIRTFTGMNRQTSHQLFLEKYGIEISDSFWDQEQERLLKVFENELIDLNKQVLQRLVQQKTRMCVASSSQRSRVIQALKITNQLDYFSEKTIFTSQQVKNGKPAPDLFLFAAEQMQVPPQDCVVIEDSFAGVEAALAANMAVIGFLGGSHAQFPWYQTKIKSYQIPLACNSTELASLLAC